MNSEIWMQAIDVLQAMLTSAIAIFGIYIAWQQHKTAKDKLKFDLFERRFAVYGQRGA